MTTPLMASLTGTTTTPVELSDLLRMDPDPFYPESGGGKKATSSNHLATKLNLDITRISNRLVVMGRMWGLHTNRAGQCNNVDDTALFLNTRYQLEKANIFYCKGMVGIICYGIWGRQTRATPRPPFAINSWTLPSVVC